MLGTSQQPLKVFTANDHDGHWPVGACSVVVATDEPEARRLLDTALIADGLKPCEEVKYTLRELDLTTPAAVILDNGEY